MKRYAIWNKKDSLITPSGHVFTAEQWIEQYPVAALPNITVICAAGEINGGYFGTLGQMVQQYENRGCDFSNCTTDQQKLDAIEAFDTQQDIAMRQAAQEAKANEEMNAAAIASIAASLEYQNMLTLEDVEEI